MATMSVHTTNNKDYKCDGCGKIRATLYVAALNPWDNIVEAACCFFCMKQYERDYIKQLNDLYAKGEMI